MLTLNHSAREEFKASALCSAGCWAGRGKVDPLAPGSDESPWCGAWADSSNTATVCFYPVATLAEDLPVTQVPAHSFIYQKGRSPREKWLKPGPEATAADTHPTYAQVAEFHLPTNVTRTGLCTY